MHQLLVTWNGSVLFAGKTKLSYEEIVAKYPGEGVDVSITPYSRWAGRARVLRSVGPYIAATALLHGIALLLAHHAPAPDALDVDRDRLEYLRTHTVQSGSTESIDDGTPLATSMTAEKPDEVGTGTRALAKGEEGKFGAMTTAGSDPKTSREEALRDASEFGMIGLLGTGDAPSASVPWGREDSVAGAHGAMWGDTIGDSFGAGGLGLHGLGAGGGGRGEGIGLGTIGTIGHGAGVVRSGSARLAAPVAQGPVQAGEWDDNANYREYRRFLTTQSGYHVADISDRQFLIARDVNGRGIPSCDIVVTDGTHTTTLRTLASGRAILFPHAEGLVTGSLQANARCASNVMSATFTGTVADEAIELKGPEPRVLAPAPAIDVAFALDTTGSMSEEIAAFKATLQKVADSITGARVNVGLVEYRDRTDEFVTRVYAMTPNLAQFRSSVGGLIAGGGGDTPESMNQGFHDALAKLAWRSDATARLLFVIADAPPHLDYPQDHDYAVDMRVAAHAGIQTFAIAASGMDALGQTIFRQIAQYTGGTEMFVLRGGAGPDSVGGGDPIASCGGTQTQYRSGNLDRLVISKIEAARRALDEDPMKIPGRGTDVGNACSAVPRNP